MEKNSKIYIAGHNGMVGNAIYQNLKAKGFTNFVFTSFPETDLRELVALWQIIPIEQNLFTTIYSFNPTLYIKLMCMEPKSYYF